MTTRLTHPLSHIDMHALRGWLIPRARRMHRRILQTAAEIDLEPLDLVHTALERLLALGERQHPNPRGLLLVIIRNLLFHRRELERRLRRAHPTPTEHPEDAIDPDLLPAPPLPDPTDLQEGADRIRQALATIDWPGPDGGPVNYRPVFLLMLRAHAWLYMQRLDRDGGYGFDDEEFDAWTSLLVPFTPDEEALAPREGWPPLRDLWPILRAVLLHANTALSARDTTAALNAHLPPHLHLKPSTWQQWLSRARTIAQQHTDPERWDATFGRWDLLRQRNDL